MLSRFLPQKNTKKWLCKHTKNNFHNANKDFELVARLKLESWLKNKAYGCMHNGGMGELHTLIALYRIHSPKVSPGHSIFAQRSHISTGHDGIVQA